MAASKAKSTKNTKFKRGDGGGSEVFTTVGEVTNLKFPGIKTTSVEVTHYDSEGVERISDAMVDGGEVTIEMNFIGSDTEQRGLREDCENGTLRNFQFVANDHAVTPTTLSVAAIVTNVDGPTAERPGTYKLSVTIEVSGLPSITFRPA